MKKIIACIAILTISSCGYFKDFKKNELPPKVRFVNMQGESKNLDLKTPAQNYEMLAKQGNVTTHTQPPAQIPAKTIAQNKYAQITPENSLQKTLAMPTDKSQAAIKEAHQKNQTKTLIKEIQYDLGKEEEKIKPKPKKQQIIYKKSRKKLYVQAGSFRTIYKARQQKNIIKKIVKKQAKVSIKNAKVKGRTYHRIVIGPYKSRKSAKLMVKKLKKHSQNAILVKFR